MLFVKYSIIIKILETPSSTNVPPSIPKPQTLKSESTKKEDEAQAKSSESQDEEVTIDDDDELMFDEEEFESVIIF